MCVCVGVRTTGDAEYVDKRCIYAAAAFAAASASRAAASAVVRTHSGALQHIREGRVEFEIAGPAGGDASCVALMGADRVLVATDTHGA